jgi:hypothetical protein
MNDRAWGELVDLIDEQYVIDNSDRREESLEDDKKLKQTVESIEFEKDNIKYRIERITGPRIIDKKTFYSGHGSANRIQYVYDPDETSSRVVFYKQLADGHYNEISPEDLMSGT